MTPPKEAKMTEQAARQIVGKVALWPYALDEEPRYFYCQGFLEGIAQERERAKGLVEALDKILKHYEIIAEGLTPYSTVYNIAKNAKEAYARGTEGK